MQRHTANELVLTCHWIRDKNDNGVNYMVENVLMSMKPQ